MSTAAKRLRIEYRPVGKLTAAPVNPRTHSPAQITQLVGSMKAFGFTNPILVDEHAVIIAGHGRLAAAQQAGMAEVPTITLAGLSDDERRALVIADNKLALNAGWDDELLRQELEALQAVDFDLSLIGFGDDELAAMLADTTDGLTDPDEVPEAPAEPVTVLGDVWLLGRHRLVCGDSTTPEAVDAALAGVRPHLMVTDPPYGVGLDPSWRDKAGANTKAKSGAGGENYMEGGKTDRDARWDAVWALSPADVFYVWCAPGPKQLDVYTALLEANFETRQFLIWDKGVLTLTRTNYWYTHETCLYGVRKGKTASWCGKPGLASVWTIPSPKHIMSGSKEKNEPHPAQKPVECMKRPIENNSSPGQAVYEPFSGSGTTIIAAEMTGRICHAIELSPNYVDISVIRWQQFTGQTATHAITGQPFGAAIPAEQAA